MTKPSDPTLPGPPPKEGSVFRAIIGFLALGAGIGGFGALYVVEIPAQNENALMFALGIIFQWGSGVISSEYGATTTGRKVAEATVKKIEDQIEKGKS